LIIQQVRLGGIESYKTGKKVIYHDHVLKRGNHMKRVEIKHEVGPEKMEQAQ